MLIKLIVYAVHGTCVAQTIATLAKFFIAHRALVWFLAGMGSLVFGVCGQITVAVVAYFALVRPLARMYTFVGYER